MFCRKNIAALVTALVALCLTSTGAVGQQYKEDYLAAQEEAKAGNLDSARGMFFESATGADAAQDAELARQARYIAAQIDFRLGNEDYRAEEFEAALAHYQAGTTVFPEYNKNQYGQGLALKKLGRIEEALEQWKAVSESGGDRRTVLAAENAIREHFEFQASSAVSRSNATRADAERAQAALAGLQEYLEPDANFFYYTAVTQYILGNMAACVSAADQALEMHRGTASDRAKIYFTKGEALVALGDVEAAKAAFQNATVGAYRQSAQHYLDTL